MNPIKHIFEFIQGTPQSKVSSANAKETQSKTKDDHVASTGIASSAFSYMKDLFSSKIPKLKSTTKEEANQGVHDVKPKDRITEPAVRKTMQKIVSFFKEVANRLNPPKPALTTQEIAAKQNRQNTVQNNEIKKLCTVIFDKTLKKLNSPKRPPNESPEVKLELLEKAIAHIGDLIDEVEVKKRMPWRPIGNTNKETLIHLGQKERELKKLHHQQLHVVIQHQLSGPHDDKERLSSIAKLQRDLDRIDSAIRDLTPQISVNESHSENVLDESQMNVKFFGIFDLPQAPEGDAATSKLINDLNNDREQLCAAAKAAAKDVAKQFDARCSELVTKGRALYELRELPDESLEQEVQKLRADFKDWQKGCSQLGLGVFEEELNNIVNTNIEMLRVAVRTSSEEFVKSRDKFSTSNVYTDKAHLYTSENGEEFRDFDPGINSKEMEVPEKLFTDEALINPPGKPSKKYLAKKVWNAMEGEVAQKALTMEAAGYELKPHAFERGPDGEIIIHDGEVHPTAASKGTKDKAIRNHLENSYEFETDDNRIILRSGKISTKERADEFVALIKQKVEEMKDNGVTLPIRLISEQVNSYGFGQDVNKDTGLSIIEEQHRWMVHTNNELSGIAEVVHVNIPSNAAVTNAKRFGVLSSSILPGEHLSREQNVEGWSKVTDWAFHDIGNGLEFAPEEAVNAVKLAQGDNALEKAKVRDRIDELVVLIHGAKIRGSKVGLKELQVELAQKRNEMKSLLLRDYEALKVIEEQIKEKPEFKPALQKVLLMKMTLGTQLEVPGASEMSRGQEGMVLLLLYKSLGVSTSLNCKSGCDRSGFWFANAAALESMEKDVGRDRMFDMVVNWDSRTAQMNVMSRAAGKTGGNIDDQIKYNENYKNIAIFRNHVLKSLLTFGLQVTATSTGVMGLKWNKGFFEENKIPLNFLPPTVTIKKKDGSRKRVPLVLYNIRNKISGISLFGSSLITKFQKYRGS